MLLETSLQVSIYSLHRGAGPCDACWGDAPTEEVVSIHDHHHSSNNGKTKVLPFEMGSSNTFVWRQGLQ